MDKKLKMKIAAAVVVILIVIGTLFYLMLPRGESGKTYIYEIEFEVSENETAWIIDIKEITLETSEKKYIFIPVREKIHHTNISINTLELVINFNIIRGFGYNWSSEHHLPKYGVQWVPEINNWRLDEGDRFIIWKEGGEDYIPRKGDQIYFKNDHDARTIRSNKVELP